MTLLTAQPSIIRDASSVIREMEPRTARALLLPLLTFEAAGWRGLANTYAPRVTPSIAAAVLAARTGYARSHNLARKGKLVAMEAKLAAMERQMDGLLEAAALDMGFEFEPPGAPCSR